MGRGDRRIVTTSASPFPPKKRKRFNLHHFLIDVKIVAVEVAATIVFLYWLGRGIWHELGR
jgi:hypothetical protein